MKGKIVYQNPDKEIVPIDESSVCGDILYGYTNVREAMKVYEQMTGEKLDKDNLQRAKVMRYEKDGEPYYFWGEKCPCCGSKNNGKLSLLNLN